MTDATSGSTTTSLGSSSDITLEGVETKDTTEKPVTVVDVSDLYDPLSSTSPGHPGTTPPSAGTTSPTTSTTTPPTTTTTTPATTTTSTTAEIIEIDQKNFPPTVNSRLPKLPVTAGKILK